MLAEAVRTKPALARAAQDRVSPPWHGAQSCIAQLLDTIDTGVLPRDLSLENGAGKSLSLTVKSRRLIRAGQGALDVELGADHVGLVAQLFAYFAADATRLKMTITEPSRSEVLSEVGLSVSTIRTALTAAGHIAEDKPACKIPTLKALAQANGLSWSIFDDGVLTDGEGHDEALQKVPNTALPHILKTEHPAAGKTASWVFSTAQGGALAITAEGHHCLVARLPMTMVQAWTNACSGR